MTFKTKGQLTALLLLTLVVGIVLIAVVMRQPSAGTNAPSGPARTMDMTPPSEGPGGAAKGTLTGRGGTGSVQDLVAGATDGLWTRVDPASGELRFKLTWKKLDPLEAGVFEIDRPRIWIIEGGRTMFVDAARGTIVWPSRDEEPESGELLGGVTLTTIAGIWAGDAMAMDESRRNELLVARSPSLGFQNVIGELRMPQETVIEGAGIRAVLSGITARFGRDDSRPLTYFATDAGGRFEYRADEARRLADASKEKPQDEGADAKEPEKDRSSEPAVYRAMVRGGATVERGTRKVSSDGIELLARTVRGRLREGAVAGFERTNGAEVKNGSRRDGEQEDARSDESLVFEWDGPLELRLIRETPVELERDDVFVRLTGTKENLVEAREETDGSVLRAGVVEYSATTRRAMLSGLGASQPITVTMPEQLEATLARVEFDLTSGVGAVNGAGELKLIRSDTAASKDGMDIRRRGAMWEERAEFSLDVSEGPVGSGDGVLPQQVRLVGKVEVHDGLAAMQGESLRAWFEPSASTAAADAGSTLRRLKLDGDAMAHDARGGIVRASTMEIEFAADEKGQAVPSFASARGGAFAERRGESLRAELIETTLRRAGDGQIEVAIVDAHENVKASLSRGEGEKRQEIDVEAPRLKADTTLSMVELIGDDGKETTITRRAADGVGKISGPSMRLSGADGANSLTVFGAGKAEFDTRGAAREEGKEPEIRDALVELTWKESLIYDDSKGRAEIEGGAESQVQIGEDERHLGRGARIIVDITPAAETVDGDRQVVRAVVEGEGDAPAELELRRYDNVVTEGGTRALLGMAALRGPSITLDAAGNQLRVDGPGLLLLEDRRVSAARESEGEGLGVTLGQGRGVRGTTLFTWEGSMVMDRLSGVGEMKQNVHVRHKDPETGAFTDLWAQSVLARVREDAGEAGASRMTLVNAEASTGVTATHQKLQLSGEKLVYFVDRGELAIAAMPGGRVVLHDGEKGTTFAAEAIGVELSTGTYRAIGVETVTVPR